MIPDGTVLANDNNGFGFFVLGDIDVLSADMTLTNLFDLDTGESHISDGYYPSGVRVINEGNGVEQSLSYRGYLDGFMYTPVEDPYYDESNPMEPLDPISMQLIGTGSYYSSFVWTTNDYTPGTVNVGQTLEGGSSDVLPLADIEAYSCSWGTTMLSLMIPATNGWTPEVRYATALKPEPPVWTLISPRTVTTNAGIWTIQFNYPAGQNNCVFRIEAWK